MHHHTYLPTHGEFENLCFVFVVLTRAETNTNTRLVLAKDFGTRIVKLLLEYSLRSHDPAHIMYLSSGMKAIIEFDWHNFFVRDTNISTFIQCVYHSCYLKSCKLFKVDTKHVKWV